jgi:membrane protease YdiL (CAAX protease family)
MTVNKFYMKIKSLVNRYPALAYFVLTFFISWLLAFLVVAPRLFDGRPIEKMAGLMMFPLMLVGPFITGVILTGILNGKAGIKALFARMGRYNVGRRWYWLLLLPPVAISAVLFFLNQIYPHHFTPNYFFIGILFGIPAGLMEEIGWSGFALPYLQRKLSVFQSAIMLGLVWGAWHLPVINFLGSATPHGSYLLPFSIAFILAMSAIRTFICYIYSQTGSLILTQLFHIMSTGSLVVLGPSPITPGREFLWYFTYGIVLWLLILICRRRLYQPVNRRAQRMPA